MVTIGDKSVLFETSVLLRANETALITTPDAYSVSFKLLAGAPGVMPTDANELDPVMVNGEAEFKIPFLQTNHTMASTTLVQFQGNEMDVLISVHGRGDFMVVHIQCRAVRT